MKARRKLRNLVMQDHGKEVHDEVKTYLSVSAPLRAHQTLSIGEGNMFFNKTLSN